VFIYNELLIFSALVGIYIYVLLYTVYGQSPSICRHVRSRVYTEVVFVKGKTRSKVVPVHSMKAYRGQ
jgi:hypothetical protein